MIPLKQNLLLVPELILALELGKVAQSLATNMIR